MAHFCQRTCHKTGEEYQAFVPSTLDETMTFPAEVIEKFTQLDQQIKALQNTNCAGLDQYFNRYITGGNSLRDGRLVSRKRLALATTGLPRDDQQAQELLEHGQAYVRAVAAGCRIEQFNVAAIAQMASAFQDKETKQGKRRTGQFRTGQGWIGGTSPLDAYYVCPPVEMVEPLISKLCDFINRDDIPASLQAAIVHMQLLIIHPLSDGNGRVGRALVEVIMRRRGIVTEISPPMFLYRLAYEENGYIAAIKDFEQEQYDKLYDYWQTANDWAINKVKQLSEVKMQFNHDCKVKLITSTIGNNKLTAPLLDSLFNQPVITSTLMATRFGCSESLMTDLLKQLAQVQIVKAYKLKQPLGAVIWDAPRLFELMAKFDQELFLEAGEALSSQQL